MEKRSAFRRQAAGLRVAMGLRMLNNYQADQLAEVVAVLLGEQAGAGEHGDTGRGGAQRREPAQR